VTEDPQEAAVLELLALLLQARPEWVTSFLLESQAPEVKTAAAMVANTMAAMAVALPPATLVTDEAGVDPLKARILATLSGRQKPRRALVVVDMQNDNLSPGSAVEVPRAREIIPALRARLDAARSEGMPVVYIIDQHEQDDPELDLWTTHNVVGSVGAEVWPEIAPKPGDKQVTKATYSAFTGSKLDELLGDLAVDTLVLTGCVTEVGVLATAMDALQKGYAVEIPPDCQAGTGPFAEGAAMTTVSLMPPFAPARRDRLARIKATLAAE
jgi:nicotinamidase/pyrazinamidase